MLAPLISPYDPTVGDNSLRLAPIGTPGHVLGLDGQGRDILSRLIWGGRVSLVIALLLATILWPSANRLNSFYRLPWPVACIGAVLVLVVLNLVVMGGFVLAVPRLLQDLPEWPIKRRHRPRPARVTPKKMKSPSPTRNTPGLTKVASSNCTAITWWF